MTSTHGPDDHDHEDWAARGGTLVAEGEVMAPLVEEAAVWLAARVPEARDVLDVGSGPGVAACTFAGALPRARVLAVDGSAPLLDMARERAGRLGVGDRFSVRQASLPDDLGDLPPSDLVWISDVLHHLPDPVAALRALGALVRPGGVLAVREGGLPARFLPDGVAPGLLPRLEAFEAEAVAAGVYPGRLQPTASWPDLLVAAGLVSVSSRSFLLDLPAPVQPQVREWVRRRLERSHAVVGDRLAAADAATLALLLDPDAKDGVLRRPDLFLLAASTIHTAVL